MDLLSKVMGTKNEEKGKEKETSKGKSVKKGKDYDELIKKVEVEKAERQKKLDVLLARKKDIENRIITLKRKEDTLEQDIEDIVSVTALLGNNSIDALEMELYELEKVITKYKNKETIYAKEVTAALGHEVDKYNNNIRPFLNAMDMTLGCALSIAIKYIEQKAELDENIKNIEFASRTLAGYSTFVIPKPLVSLENVKINHLGYIFEHTYSNFWMHIQGIDNLREIYKNQMDLTDLTTVIDELKK